MIDLESLSFRVDFNFLEFEGTLREDGFYVEKKEEGIEGLTLKMDDFVVRINSMEFYIHKKENAWDFVLPVIKEYFTTVDPEILRPLCTPAPSHSGILCFHLNRYNEKPQQSEQDDMFIANYTDWIYMQFDFDYQFNTLFSIEEFRRVLNHVHHTHSVHDRGWPETKIFMQELTVENISKTFQKLIKLRRMERDINKAMQKTCDDFYAKHSEAWILEL